MHEAIPNPLLSRQLLKAVLSVFFSRKQGILPGIAKDIIRMQDQRAHGRFV